MFAFFSKYFFSIFLFYIVVSQTEANAGGIVNLVNTERRSLESSSLSLLLMFSDFSVESIILPVDYDKDILFHPPKQPFLIYSSEVTGVSWLPGERPEHWYYLQSCLFEDAQMDQIFVSNKNDYLPPIYLVKAVEVLHISSDNEISIQWENYPGAEFYQVNIFAGFKEIDSQPNGKEAFINFPGFFARIYTQSPSVKFSNKELVDFFNKWKDIFGAMQHRTLNLLPGLKAPENQSSSKHNVGIQIIARGASQEVLSKSPYYYITTIEVED